ncbi:HIV Tat-specific factor 1-like [Dreissena polymorpha]|nr:HIV Tat-specific factor 1-like [Dreissena polymorpha]
MGDIDFEEQLELERLEREKAEKEKQAPPGVREDPDGTKYEWDPDRQAWFPKIDTDFIAQYQMNYGVAEEAGGETDKEKQNYEYYQNYYAAAMREEQLLSWKPKESAEDESHEETVQKLEHLENTWQAGGDESEEEMLKYTDEQKKQYNEYWSYYYGSDYHDYYADCMAQYEAGAKGGGVNTEMDGVIQETSSTQVDADKKKKAKKKRPPPRDEGWFDVNDEHNTNVYVSGLPFDITQEEFKEMMTKYGLVMYDPRSKQPKLKLYLDENGQPKGDGRCCFIKKESVDLILNLLDGADYRGHTIAVQRAQFTMKGNYDPTKKKKKLSNREKNKLKERQAKLFDWRPDKPRGAREKHEKVVILKNVFDPSQFEDDPVKIQTLKSNIQTECGKYGDVKKVVVYDRHEDGVVQVHFSEAEEADMCVEYMNQRFLALRRLLAATWDGKTKYEVLESEAEREERIKKWAEFLETGGEGGVKAAAGNGAVGGEVTGVTESGSSSTNVGDGVNKHSEGDGTVSSGNGVSLDAENSASADALPETDGGASTATGSDDYITSTGTDTDMIISAETALDVGGSAEVEVDLQSEALDSMSDRDANAGDQENDMDQVTSTTANLDNYNSSENVENST